MKIKMKTMALVLATICLLSACSSGSGTEPGGKDPVTPTPEVKQVPISINATVVAPTTDSRATDNGFEMGDNIGVYIVNRNADGTAQPLHSQGNHADNLRFTYNGSWTPANEIYWEDETTAADFYLYYPYTSSIANVAEMPFEVDGNQSAEAAYKASDLLIGTTANVTPTESAVSIMAKHVMSQIIITLAAGNGFTEESLAASVVSVKVNGVKTQATVNLATSAVTATGTATTLTPLQEAGDYKAIIVPQTVVEGNLITITIDGRDYNLKKGFTFESGKRHRFTVTPNKTSEGVNVTIDTWDDDGIDHGGNAE